MIKKVLALCLMALFIPYITTLAFTGTSPMKEFSDEQESGSGRIVELDRGGQSVAMDAEAYLVGILAKQISPDYQPETLKAQAVIARTYLYKQMGEEKRIAESSLDLDYLETNQMEKLWGKENYITCYRKLEQAVKDTKGMVLQHEGVLIDPLYHSVSAGRTRTGDELHPYLQPVDSPRDVEADSYLTVAAFSKSQFAEKINTIPDAAPVDPEGILETLQVVEKDPAGYILSMQIGSKTYTGEQIQYALGLPSSSFLVEEYEDGLRCVVKGQGHGYGFSQYGANLKAKEGWSAQELLQYYYKNIVLISE